MIFISENEFYNLQGLPHLCWPVYCHIRRMMDVKTGLGGELYPISLNGLADDSRIEESQGKRNTGRPTISKIRTAIDNLIKVGLLESRSIVTAGQKKLIFFLPIAFASLCERNKVRSDFAHKDSTEDNTVGSDKKFVNSEGCADNNVDDSTQVRAPIAEKSRTYKRINNYINTQTRAREVELKIPQHAEPPSASMEPLGEKVDATEFKPSPELISQAKAMGLSLADDPLTLLEFITHAKAHGKLYHDWNAGFLQWLIRGERFVKSTKTRNERHAKRTTNKSNARKASLVEQVQQHGQFAATDLNVLLFRRNNEAGHSGFMGEVDHGLWS